MEDEFQAVIIYRMVWIEVVMCAMKAGRPREFNTEQALDLATELFWRKGYEGTSLSDLTDRLGITRPSLYAAFGNKETLFRLALDRYEAKAGAYRTRALNAPTAHAMARQLLEGAADLHGDKNNPVGCLGVHGALACSEEADVLRQEVGVHAGRQARKAAFGRRAWSAQKLREIYRYDSHPVRI